MAYRSDGHIFDNPRNIKRVLISLYVCCALSVLAEFLVHRHVDHPWEALFGFYSIYGFIACTILVLAATQMRKLIMRKEAYYDD